MTGRMIGAAGAEWLADALRLRQTGLTHFGLVASLALLATPQRALPR